MSAKYSAEWWEKLRGCGSQQAQSRIWPMSQANAYSRILAPSCWNIWSGQPSGGQAIIYTFQLTPKLPQKWSEY